MTDATKHKADTLLPARADHAPVTRSAPVVAKDNYEGYRSVLRWDFWYSCAYCTLAESEASGVAFSIDHYLPQSRYPELVATYDNLLWSCNHCNSFKRAFPTEPAARKGYRFFRPDIDDPDDHFGASPMSPVRLDAKTELVGKYSIEQLNLNRQTLRRLREIRTRLAQSHSMLVRGLRSLEGVKLQSLPRETRVKFMQIRARLEERSKTVSEILDATLLREFSRSELIDPPVEATHDAQARRRYLKAVNATLPAPSSNFGPIGREIETFS